MGRVFYIGVVLFGAVIPFLAADAASAQEFNQTITVYAAVPEQRGIYVDKVGNIIKIAGNTSNNIIPQVYTAENKLIPMNDAIQKQYEQFLTYHHNHLEAGKTYVIPATPVAVSEKSDSRDIQINTNNLTLGAQQP